jgi:virulence-associated protein VapD
MKVLVSEKLSEHKYKTPEGYLICTDAILARTGKQTYTKDEVFGDGDNTEIDVDRPYDQVMNPKTIASFENKPVTFDHPSEDVNVGNYKDYAIGYVRDVHQGKTDDGEDVIMGNLVITDQAAIDAIEQGDHTDLSCGYDCDIKDDNKGEYMQTNIRGNHVALCEQGRAGIAHIVDSEKLVDQRVKDSEWSSEWADLDALGISDEDKASVEKYFKKLASKYGVSYVRTDYSYGYPCPTFRGNRKNLEKLILNEYVGGSKSDAEKEYEFIEDSVTKDSKMRDKFYTLSTKWDDRQDFARIAKMYNLKAYSNDTIEGSVNNIEEFIHNYCKESFDRDRLYDSRTNDNDDGYTYKLTKKKNDYDEYVVQAYKNGKKYEGATYYTDDWEDAIGTIKMFAKLEKLNFRQQGSVYIADNKTNDNDSKQTTFVDALKVLNIVASIKARDTATINGKDYDKIMKNDIIKKNNLNVKLRLVNSFARSAKAAVYEVTGPDAEKLLKIIGK